MHLSSKEKLSDFAGINQRPLGILSVQPGTLPLTYMLFFFHLLKDVVWKERKHLKAALYAMADKADKRHYPQEGSVRLGKPEMRLRMLLPKHSS